MIAPASPDASSAATASASGTATSAAPTAAPALASAATVAAASAAPTGPADAAAPPRATGLSARPTAASAPLVTLEGVSVSLGGRPVLSGIDLTLRPGEIVTVVGPNGSGKTTLMRTIIGAVAPDRGRVARAAGLRLAYVPQRLAVDPSMPMTVADFMALPRRPRAAVAAALAGAGLSGLARRQVAALSGGQLQRVLLARALMGAPQLLILDEGAAGLDQAGVAAFYSRIERVRAETGCAILLVSHDLQIVMRASDRVICLNGHICCAGAPEIVSASPAYRGFFGAQGAMALYRHHHDHVHEDGLPCAAATAAPIASGQQVTR